MEIPVRLTQTVQKGGCAAKVAASELRKVLARVQFPPTPQDLIVGAGTFDDAAVYRVTSDTALVQTLDFFTPIVDTPRLFGRIAATNALSDVYAMGGKPKTAMAIFAFPLATLDTETAVEVLQGASDAIAAANAALVGGHTIDDDTMKFGLSVTGYVHPEHIWTNAGAKVDDILILTKPLGTGTLTAALKRGEVGEDDIRDGLDSMCLLNDAVSLLEEAPGFSLLNAVHAATDITGFGLTGHAFNMARASGVSLNFESSRIPRFERAMELMAKGFLTKAHRTNAEYVREQTRFPNLDVQQLTCDPQTSGGLLLSVDAVHADDVLARLLPRFPFAQAVGTVTPQKDTFLSFA